MSDHMPGPWTYQVLNRDDRTSFMVSIVEGDPAKWQTIAECSFDAPRANAGLIAAAPDLLAALERIDEHVTAFPKQELEAACVNTVRAAIAKARGDR
jgi:hypothetical protein